MLKYGGVSKEEEESKSFTPLTLLKDIEGRWGLAGAHADLFKSMMHIFDMVVQNQDKSLFMLFCTRGECMTCDWLRKVGAYGER